MRPRIVVVAAALLLCFVTAGTQAQPAPSALATRIRAIVTEAGLGDRVGVVAVDAVTGVEIVDINGDAALNPASNMKLVTAAAAMLELGPDFTMLTGLYGRVEDPGRVSQLVLRGQGDPTLRTSDLVELAEALTARGVTVVGQVVVDGTYFDDQILPPAFEQQPDEIAAFRAPVGAVSVERSSFVLRVRPGREVGAPPVVSLRAPGYFDLDNAMTTAEGGPPNVIAIQRGDGDRMELRLRGTMPLGGSSVAYRRRVENPLAYAGHAMVEALGQVGIRVNRGMRIGTVEGHLPLLAARRSPPIAELLSALGKSSDNFVAEMVLKVLGAEARRPGTSAQGAQVAAAVLQRAGAPEGSFTIINGSGLFDGNEIAASHLARLLAHVYRDEAIRPEYVAHLAVGGVDGTLHRRLRDLPAPRVVRAKTGTLNDTIALSGYVLGPEPGQAVAFSVLCNGVRGRQGAARRMADDVATAIARHLHPTTP